MGSKWFPFGGGARYLSVLAGPLCLLLLLLAPRSEIKPLLLAAWRWSQPFLPFVVGWTFAQFWHQYNPLDFAPLSRLFWCALLFIGARLVGITHRQLAVVACIAATAYCVIALGEVFLQGRARAWGEVYENRFGQYAIWLAALCVLHAVLGKLQDKSRVLLGCLLVASLLGLFAALLSGSRGALSILPVLMLVLLSKTMDWRRGALIALAMTAVLAVVLGGVCYLYNPMCSRLELIYQEAWNYFNEPVFSPTSIGARLELARISLLTWLDHPLLGTGYTSLTQLYATHPALGTPHPAILGIPGFHSDWFQAIGIGGGLLLVSLLTSCVWMFVAAKRDVYRLSFLGFAIVFSFIELFFCNKMGLSLLMVCWALYAAAEQNRECAA